MVDGFRKSPVGWLSHEQKCGLIEGAVILSIKKGKQDIRQPGNQGWPLRFTNRSKPLKDTNRDADGIDNRIAPRPPPSALSMSVDSVDSGNLLIPVRVDSTT